MCHRTVNGDNITCDQSVNNNLKENATITNKDAHWGLGGIIVPHCGIFMLTRNQLETQRCVFSTVAADALELNHQAISIQSAEQGIVVLDRFHTEILHLH